MLEILGKTRFGVAGSGRAISFERSAGNCSIVGTHAGKSLRPRTFDLPGVKNSSRKSKCQELVLGTIPGTTSRGGRGAEKLAAH